MAELGIKGEGFYKDRGYVYTRPVKELEWRTMGNPKNEWREDHRIGSSGHLLLLALTIATPLHHSPLNRIGFEFSSDAWKANTDFCVVAQRLSRHGGQCFPRVPDTESTESLLGLLCPRKY